MKSRRIYNIPDVLAGVLPKSRVYDLRAGTVRYANGFHHRAFREIRQVAKNEDPTGGRKITHRLLHFRVR